jgi:hypothetical protein
VIEIRETMILEGKPRAIVATYSSTILPVPASQLGNGLLQAMTS